jgi:hypothetical protein
MHWPGGNPAAPVSDPVLFSPNDYVGGGTQWARDFTEGTIVDVPTVEQMLSGSKVSGWDLPNGNPAHDTLALTGNDWQFWYFGSAYPSVPGACY